MNEDFNIDLNELEDIDKKLTKDEIRQLNDFFSYECREIILKKISILKKIKKIFIYWFIIFSIFSFLILYFSLYFIFLVILFFIVGFIVFHMVSSYLSEFRSFAMFEIFPKLAKFIDKNIEFKYFKEENFEEKNDIKFLFEKNFLKKYNEFFLKDYLNFDFWDIKLFWYNVSKSFVTWSGKTKRYSDTENFYLFKIIFKEKIFLDNFKKDWYSFFISENILYVKKDEVNYEISYINITQNMKNILKNYVRFYLLVKEYYLFSEEIVKNVENKKDEV